MVKIFGLLKARTMFPVTVGMLENWLTCTKVTFSKFFIVDEPLS